MGLWITIEFLNARENSNWESLPVLYDLREISFGEKNKKSN